MNNRNNKNNIMNILIIIIIIIILTIILLRTQLMIIDLIIKNKNTQINTNNNLTYII